jgi:hypothetical protein
LEEAWAESKPAADKEDLKIPAGAKVVRCGPPALACPGALEVPRRTLYYAFPGKPPLTTPDFDVDTAKKAFDPNQGTIVRVRLTKEGRGRFHTLTRRIARAGRLDRQFHHVALVVDDRLVAFPIIDYEQTPGGVNSDVVQISGLTPTEADDLAKELRGD